MDYKTLITLRELKINLEGFFPCEIIDLVEGQEIVYEWPKDDSKYIVSCSRLPGEEGKMIGNHGFCGLLVEARDAQGNVAFLKRFPSSRNSFYSSFTDVVKELRKG